MRTLPVDIAFVQTDLDTFRSTEKVTSTPEVSPLYFNPHPDTSLPRSKADQFFGVLQMEGIDANADTRPRDVPFGESPNHFMNAAFTDDDGRMVIDVSVLRELQKKYDVEVSYSPMRNNPKVDNASTKKCLPN